MNLKKVISLLLPLGFLVSALPMRAASTTKVDQPVATLASTPTATKVADFKKQKTKTEGLRQRVATLQSASKTGKGASVAAQADLIDAKADLMEAEMEEANAKARIADSLKDPAVETLLDEMKKDMIMAKSEQECQSIRIRLILLHQQENERISQQVNSLSR